jgi:hypothetical protein
MATVGHATATNMKDTIVHIHNTAIRTPCVIAFVIEGDEDVVYLGHLPYIYPADIANPTVIDARIIVLVGNRSDACMPVVLPADAFGRTSDIRASDIATIMGAAGHGAAPPEYRTGPHVAGPTVNQLRVRRAVMLPPSFAATAVSYRDDGCLTLAAFYAQFVLNKHDSAVAAEAQMWSHVALWFRLALTNNNANKSVVSVVPVKPATPPGRMSSLTSPRSASVTYSEGRLRRAGTHQRRLPGRHRPATRVDDQ